MFSSEDRMRRRLFCSVFALAFVALAIAGATSGCTRGQKAESDMNLTTQQLLDWNIIVMPAAILSASGQDVSTVSPEMAAQLAEGEKQMRVQFGRGDPKEARRGLSQSTKQLVEMASMLGP